MSELRGELRILYDELNSRSAETKKDALKKVIVYMSVGKDVSAIFQSVIKCIELPDIEIKKLIYLYIINYSRSKPNDAIMIIHQFVKDVENKSSPLIRALAIRTMGCLRVQGLNEYLVNPQKEGLMDPNPYVRKTAVQCVSKVYEISPELIKMNNLIEELQKIIEKDMNSMVFANAIQALQELSMISDEPQLKIDKNILDKVLVSINECFEWGQVFILEILCDYKAENRKEAEYIIDRLLPRMSHINPSIVFTAIKCIVIHMQGLDTELKDLLVKKLSKPLRGLLNSNYEVKYLVLKFSQVLINLYPGLLGNEYAPFICSYSDPVFIKLEKMEQMSNMANNQNVKKILNEFYEYHKDINGEFVCISISYLTNISQRFSESVNHAQELLNKIILNISGEINSDILDQLAICGTKIIRAYPSTKKAQEFTQSLASKFKHLSISAAKVAFLYLLGIYCSKITEAGSILEYFRSKFDSLSSEVQLQLFNSAVKMYIKEIEPVESILSELLESIANNSDYPDQRDRAFFYWRIQSVSESNLELPKDLVFTEYPAITLPEQKTMTEAECYKKLPEIGRLSGGLNKTAKELFGDKTEFVKRGQDVLDSETFNMPSVEKPNETDNGELAKKTDLLETSGSTNLNEKSATQSLKLPNRKGSDNAKKGMEIDLLDMDFANANAQVSTNDINLNNDVGGKQNLNNKDDFDIQGGFADNNQEDEDLFADHDEGFQQITQDVTKVEFRNPGQETLVKKDTAGKNGKKGLVVKGNFERINTSNQLFLNLNLKNKTSENLSGLNIQFYSNFFGLKVSKPSITSIQQNQSIDLKLNVDANVNPNTKETPSNPYNIIVACKISQDLFYFKVYLPFHLLFDNTFVEMEKTLFKNLWSKLDATANATVFLVKIVNQSFRNADILTNQLKENNILIVQSKVTQDEVLLYTSCKDLNGVIHLSAQKFENKMSTCEIFSKSEKNIYENLVFDSFAKILE